MTEVKRLQSRRLKTLLKQFPIVCVLGPRQCGKTTLVQSTLKKWHYIDVERPSDHIRVTSDPEDFLSEHPGRIIFDEAQLAPELFPVLRGFIDQSRRQMGRYVLTGSASFQLIRNLSESLAGRVGFVDVFPFHVLEIEDMDRLWIRGGFPESYLAKSQATSRDWLESYIRTFLERDLHRLGIEFSVTTMRRLWQMLAHLHGGLLNASELGNSLGITYHTVNRYLDILEQTFLIRRLAPYYVNISKRLIKRPKIYVRDSGLLHYFLGISDKKALKGHPVYGASWEGFALEQIFCWFSLNDPGATLYYWRTATGQEADLLIQTRGRMIAVEFKAHSAPDAASIRGLKHAMSDLKLDKAFVIKPAGESYSLGKGITACDLKTFFRNLRRVPVSLSR